VWVEFIYICYVTIKPKKIFVTPFSINWKFDNRNFIQSDPECGTILLNVWDRVHEKRKYFGVGLRCKAEVFEAITGNFTTVKKEIRSNKKWSKRSEPLTQREKNQILNDSQVLKQKIVGAMNKAQELNSFDFCRNLVQFEKLLNESTSYYVHEMFNKKIKDLENNNQWKTAESYTTTKNSIFEYYRTIKRSSKSANEVKANLLIKDSAEDILVGIISFAELDPQFLKGYEKHLQSMGGSKNGIAVYMRNIRHIFKMAIELGVTKQSFYPFGKGLNTYKIKNEIKPKEVLDLEDWSKLVKYKTPYPARTKALEMFKLSYALNGTNAYDICTMLKSDLKKEHIQFYRKKSDRKNNNISRIVYRTDFIDYMINKYSSEIESPYLLDLLDPEYKLDTKETRRRCSNINKSWDKQLKKIAKALELPPISPMWARHQRSTKLIDDGATKEEINTILGHDSMKTTETYIHSFPSAQKIKLKAEKLDNELM